MAPVFSLVLDRDVTEDLALLYPELYKELTKVCLPMIVADAAGAVLELQNVLHLAHDQCLPRSGAHTVLTLTS